MTLGLFDAYVVVQKNEEVGLCVLVYTHALVHILGQILYKSRGGGVEHGGIGPHSYYSTRQTGIYEPVILNTYNNQSTECQPCLALGNFEYHG